MNNYPAVRVLLDPKKVERRNDRIYSLVLERMSAPKIYRVLKSENLIQDSAGNCQTLGTVIHLVQREREDSGRKFCDLNRIRTFQKMQTLGFNRKRIVKQMKLTDGSYNYLYWKYGISKGPVICADKVIELNAKLVKKTLKMVRLGYCKQKVMSHMQLTDNQYSYIRRKWTGKF